MHVNSVWRTRMIFVQLFLSTKRMHILFIDDDPEDIEFFTEILFDIDPHLTSDVFSECKEIETRLPTLQTPDIIFLDAHMSPVNGKQCLLLVKSMVNPDLTKIFIQAGTLSPLEKAEFHEIGITGIIMKDGSYSDIKAGFRSALASQE